MLLLYCYSPRIAPLIEGNIIANVVYIEYVVVVVVVGITLDRLVLFMQLIQTSLETPLQH